MNRVVITGMGWITPMGHTIEDVWRRLLAGESGIARTSLFDASTFPTSISAEVKDFDLSKHVPNAPTHAGVGRNTSFALAACAQAWQSAGLPAIANRGSTKLTAGKSQIANPLDLDRVGIYLGSGEGSLDFDAYTAAALTSWTEGASEMDSVKWAQIALERMNVTREIEQEPNMPLSHLAILIGARGP